jgi:phosphoribosylformimino-5-aminoimidazole carboxamide ribotide isomerase
LLSYYGLTAGPDFLEKRPTLSSTARRKFFAMHFLPVLDVLNGIVVRAVGGRRSEYQPLVSRLTAATEPLAVAEAIRAKYDWSELYVADLDAITACGSSVDRELISRFHIAGFRLWLDAGVRDLTDAERLSEWGIDHIVCGLETLHDLAGWRQMVSRLGPGRAVFSLDLRSGRPLGENSDPLAIAERVIADGCRQMIVLDLAHVGLAGGTGTEALCAELLRRHQGLEVYSGGGIRGWEDVRQLDTIGVAGVLLSSAIHNGRLDAHSRSQ